MTEMNDATVAQLLALIRAEVRRRSLRPADDALADQQALRDALDDIELHRVVSAHWPLEARGPLGRLLVLAQKVVRRGLAWYINPIVEQQNRYNDAVARTLRALADAYRDIPPADAPMDAPPPPPADTVPRDAAALQRAVAARAADEPPAAFAELALAPALTLTRQAAAVSAHLPLGGAGVPGALRAALQRGLRLALRWLVNPIVEQQNRANDAIHAALAALVRHDDAVRAGMAARRATRRPRP
ncbi:MAG: hypothetical protein KGS47_08440 [Chloroflexi bacterium]|nr:hypothetical protein [Chloroflexota bacterium]